MATVIEFYVPKNFKPTTRWVPPDQRGKVVEFPCAACAEVSMRSGTTRIHVRNIAAER